MRVVKLNIAVGSFIRVEGVLLETCENLRRTLTDAATSRQVGMVAPLDVAFSHERSFSQDQNLLVLHGFLRRVVWVVDSSDGILYFGFRLGLMVVSLKDKRRWQGRW